MSSNHPRYAQGHVLVTAAFIGSLALVLAAGLGALGLTAQADAAFAGALCRVLQQDGGTGFQKSLPAWGLWLGAALLAYGLALAMLSVPGTWRRLVLWLTTVLVLAAWAPVLALAAHAPELATPLIAALWSGACSLVYVRSHRMPCDAEPG
ncbi:MAG: hypothetical protein NTW21_06535 [Verrucomicrobia bacterium]|nr:hypothetical protein [Verrucomicrobiota bacterium]